jgi:hypothetical protein
VRLTRCGWQPWHGHVGKHPLKRARHGHAVEQPPRQLQGSRKAGIVPEPLPFPTFGAIATPGDDDALVALLAPGRVTGALESALLAASLPLEAAVAAGVPILGGGGGFDALDAKLNPVVGMSRLFAAAVDARDDFCARFSIVCTACAISS